MISAGSPGGGTTGEHGISHLVSRCSADCFFSVCVDYAIDMFYKAAENNRFECFLDSNTRLPMIYLPDCLRATVEFLETPSENLKLRTYNVTGMSFTPTELLQTLKKYYPKLEVTYAPDYRQGIGEWW